MSEGAGLISAPTIPASRLAIYSTLSTPTNLFTTIIAKLIPTSKVGFCFIKVYLYYLYLYFYKATSRLAYFTKCAQRATMLLVSKIAGTALLLPKEAYL